MKTHEEGISQEQYLQSVSNFRRLLRSITEQTPMTKPDALETCLQAICLELIADIGKDGAAAALRRAAARIERGAEPAEVAH